MELKLKSTKPVEPEKVLFEAELTVRDTIKIVCLSTRGKFIIEKQLNTTEARVLREGLNAV